MKRLATLFALLSMVAFGSIAFAGASTPSCCDHKSPNITILTEQDMTP